MSFEEDKIQLSLTSLRETEKKCAGDIGWLKSVKTKMFGGRSLNLADTLESQIILADTQVCVAIITFLQQDFSGYLKGGWVLRKAWKVYQHTYAEILDLYKKKFGELNLPEPTDFQWTNDLPVSGASSSSDNPHDSMSSDWTIPSSSNDRAIPSQNGTAESNVDSETVARLMGAVCFGYGVLQLGISLLPPSLLKITNFLGFGGNRSAGISNLMYSRKGSDMRAPLAMLALLWYHTIVRPFYALDGTNVKAGVEAATLLIKESEKDYGQSALFLFFKGRIHRLNSNIPRALESFQQAAENSLQREIKLLCLHEVGWCHLIQLDYEQAQETFTVLKNGSRWSRSFYTYLLLICSGSCKKLLDSSLVIELKKNLAVSNQKGSQLEIFMQRRINIFPENEKDLFETTAGFWKILVYELLFLWNALPSCSFTCIDTIIQDCEEIKEDPMPGLAMLVQGECYNILGHYDNAITSFQKCLNIRASTPPKDDIHVAAFAEYELGAILIKNRETRDEGKNLIIHANTRYKDYDFDNKLQVRIEMALKYLS